jgi:hypothetical protein
MKQLPERRGLLYNLFSTNRTAAIMLRIPFWYEDHHAFDVDFFFNYLLFSINPKSFDPHTEHRMFKLSFLDRN